MQTSTIELLVIGNTPSEVEGYLTALRNSGIAVHPHQIESDPAAFSEALDRPVDVILHTLSEEGCGVGELIIKLRKKGLLTPLIALTDHYDHKDKAHLMSMGASDLIPRNENDLLVQVIKREYAYITLHNTYSAAQQKLKEADELYNTLAESSRDAIAYVHEGMHIRANSVYLKQFGFASEDEVEGLPILDMISSAGHKELKDILRKMSSGKLQHAEMKATGLRSDGSEFTADLSFLPASIDGEACTQVTIRDQSLSNEVEEKLRLLSTQDTHTGLYSRQYFLNLLEDSHEHFTSKEGGFALFYITLDNFQKIRATAGIQISDQILKDVALLLKNMAGPEDHLARFGDHTFTLLTRPKNQQAISSLGEQICGTIKQHDYHIHGRVPNPSCSIGVACASPGISGANEFISHAYQACEQARANGGNQLYLASEQLAEETEETGSEANLAKLIQHALDHEQFRLVYQPIVSLHGDSRENYAVLVRLLDNNQEEIHPDHFLSQIQAMGKTAELDRWVIKTAIAKLAKHRAKGEKINFFINISGASLENDPLLLWICDCLREHEAKGSWFVFQISESDARLKLPEIQKLAEGLHKIKCKLSIDHFGLLPKPETLLSALPVDFVQYDPKLLQGLSENQQQQDQLNQLNALISNTETRTIAAGVEEPNSLAILWTVGVNYIRGYFIQEPSPKIGYDFKSETLI
jgi:diguanylate cyclase (GGDEF)-like protein/PAS domain S-box-containing protein